MPPAALRFRRPWWTKAASAMANWPPTWDRLLLLPALVVGFTVHELAHALVAYLLGDTGQVARKRLSLNPLRHVSVPGMVAFMLLGIGWAKPVSVDTARFTMRNQAFGFFLVSVAGSLSNLVVSLAAVAGVSVLAAVVGSAAGVPWMEVVRYLTADQVGLDRHGLAVALSSYMVSVNLVLALFNLIPLPPLDGFNALMGLVGAVRSARARGSAVRPASSLAPAAGPGEDRRSPAEIHFQIALVYHQEGQLDEAIARYRQALGHEQALSLAHYNLGLAYWAKGRADLAAQALKAAGQAADPVLRAKAEQCLRELAAAGDGQDAVPPPLASPPAAVDGRRAVEPLDPVVRRRLWLRLILGTAGFAVAAGVAFVYVAMVTLAAFVGG